MRIVPIIRLIRPWQWVKNGFVFLPMFFGGRLFDVDCWLNSIVAFIAFSLIASAVYCFNDIKDVDDDRLHPKKQFRPIASGEVSVSVAWCMLAILAAGSFAVAYFFETRAIVWAILTIYALLNVAYCVKLKQIAVVDVFIVSFGFVLRLFVGGIVCGIELSAWIVCMTFLIALFLSFAKRRDDIILYEREGIVVRKNILRYNLAFINQALGIIGSVTLVCYIMYTLSPEVMARLGNRYVYSTSLFVLAGILRYLQVTIVDMKSGSPTKVLLNDRFIQVCLVCWIVLFAIIIYV